VEREVTKQEFKELFFKHGVAQSSGGWTEDYWDKFYEHENNAQYFFTEPDLPDQVRMFISSGKGTHRILLLSEEAEESLFEFPEP
jgi:hypothetical protein